MPTPQIYSADLVKNKELAELITDLEPGDYIYGKLRISAKDDQTARLELEEVAETPDELNEGADDAEESDEDDSDESDPEDTANSKGSLEQSDNPFAGGNG